MVKFKNGEGLRLNSERDLPFLLLIIAGVMEFVFITMESLFSYIGYYLVEDYIIVPCLLFVGIAMTRKLTHVAKKQMLLAVVAVAWFVVVQMIHKLSGMGTHPIGTVFFVYLMAFPFASVTEDNQNIGLRWIGKILVAASLILVLYTIMLMLDCVLPALKPYLFWDGARLHVFWHPNMSACFFMIGIAFCSVFFFQEERRMRKLLLVVAIVLQYAAMALTNCRTTLLMTSAFFGGIAFFVLYNGKWKRLAVGLLAAVMIMLVSFSAAGKAYELHNHLLVQKITEQLQEKQEVTADGTISSEAADTASEVVIVSDNQQSTLSKDMKTLNGRTWIWKAALSAIKDNKRLLLWGTEYVGPTISVYNFCEVVHAHNSWMEMLMKQGLPGLLIALVYSCLAVRAAWVLVWNQQTEIWKKIIAMLTMCVMVTGVLEPYLFITNVYYQVTDFVFFLCTGYLIYWHKQLPEKKTV